MCSQCDTRAGSVETITSSYEPASSAAEAAIVDVGIAASVDDDLVPGTMRDHTQVAVNGERPVRFVPNELALLPGHHQKPAIRKPIDTERNPGRPVHNARARPVGREREDLALAPIADPQAAVVPAWRLADPQSVPQHARAASHRRTHAP